MTSRRQSSSYLSTTAPGRMMGGWWSRCSPRSPSSERATIVDRVTAGMERKAAASAPDAEVIAEMRRNIEHALTHGTVPARKALFHEIRAEGRDRVAEWFRVPGGANPTETLERQEKKLTSYEDLQVASGLAYRICFCFGHPHRESALPCFQAAQGPAPLNTDACPLL